MNIGMVCYPTYGGSGVVATELGKALAEKGHQVHFVTYSRPARLDAFLPNVSFHEVTFQNYALFEFPPYETALAGSLVDVVENNDLDILHVHYAIPHASAALIARDILKERGRYVPIVTTLHGTDITLVGKAPSYRPVVAHSIGHSDGVTGGFAESQARHLCQLRCLHRHRSHSQFHRLRPLQSHRQGAFQEGHRTGWRGHPHPHVQLPQGQARARRGGRLRPRAANRPAKLLLVGDGPERVNVEQRCREQGLCDHIRFLGKQDAIEELLAVADVFLMPSESESFGLAALEAMACGVPVVSSNAGGIPEVNEHGFSGFLSDVGDVDAMAEHVEIILEDADSLTRFKENAIAQAKKFELSTILPRYEAFYQEVLDRATVVG